MRSSLREFLGPFSQRQIDPVQWQSVALGGGAVWAPGSLFFYKDAEGIVHWRHDLYTISASIPAGTTITTLPPGYRPRTLIAVGMMQWIASTGGTQNHRRLELTAGGVLSPGLATALGGSTLQFFFSHCSYPGEL